MPSSLRTGMVDCNVSGALVRRSRIEPPKGLKIYFRYHLNQRAVGAQSISKAKHRHSAPKPFLPFGCSSFA